MGAVAARGRGGRALGNPTWSVRGKAFAWERPFSKADIKRYGDVPPPDGAIVAVRVEDLAEKEAILQAGRRGVFTIPHFDGYAGVLLHLRSIAKGVARDLVIDGWLACAPRALAEQHLAAIEASRRRRSRR